MSEATARLLLAELDATEALLRGLAAENLSYRQILGVERLASRRCADLLARVGFVEPTPVWTAVGAQPEPVRAEEALAEDFARDATDELLSGVVAQSIGNAPGPDRMALSDADFDVLDDGPEGVAEEAHDLVSDEHTAEPDLLPEAELELQVDDDVEDDDDTAESAASEEFDEPVLSASTGFEVELEDATEPEPFEPDSEADTEDPGYLGARSWEETGVPNLDADTILLADPLAPIPPEPPPAKPAESWVSYVSYGDDQAVESDDSPTLSNRAAASAPAADPYAHLVSYVSEEASPEEEQPEEPAPVLDPEIGDDWGRRRREILMSDVGADALVTMEEHSTVLMSDMLGGSDVPGEVDEESFDLMPDVSEEADIHEDDEVTIVRSEDKPRAPVRATAPPISDTPSWAASSPPSPTRTAPPPTPKPITPAAPRAAAAAGVGTGGLYGGAAVPTIRDSDDPRPRAAAIQLNAGGGGGARVLGLEEEEEPIEIGAAEDDPDHVAGSGSGFSLQVQEYEEEVYEEEEEEEEDEEVIEDRPPELPPGPTAAELAALLDRAQTAATNGDLQGGADLYSDLLDQDPDNLDAHVARGRLYLDLGDYSRAMSDFSVAEDIDPANPEPQVAIGDLYFARKDYRKAIDFFNAALELAPNHAMAYCRRGISHYYRKNYPEAVADLEKANKLDGDIPNIKSYVSMAKKKSK